MNRNLFLGLIACVLLSCPVLADLYEVVNDSIWYDTDGYEIQASMGGHITLVGDTYWWVGNDQNENETGPDIRLYSSQTLGSASWKFETLVADLTPINGRKNCTLLYNPNTDRFVIICKGISFYQSVSNDVRGPYDYIHKINIASMHPLPNFQSGGMSAYREGNDAYIIVSMKIEGGRDRWVDIIKLTPDFLNFETPLVYAAPSENNREAYWLFVKDGQYYMTYDGPGGWKGSDCYYQTATNLAGPWSAEVEIGMDPEPTNNIERSHASQSRWMMKFGDQWTYGGDRYPIKEPSSHPPENGQYIFCPVVWDGGHPTVKWEEVWSPLGTGNNAPSFNANPFSKSDATEDTAYSDSIAGDATDPDVGDTLTFSRVAGPTWLTIAADGTISGTPTNADVGINGWTVLADDGNGGTDMATMNITVNSATGNNPPSFNTDPINEINATEGQAYSSTLADDASDPDSDPLTFSKVSGPAWLLIASSGALSGTPGAGDVGANAFTVEVDDGNGGTDQATLNIDVISASAGGTLTLNPTDDTFVTSGNPTANKGSNTALKVSDATRESFLKFNVSGVTSVNSATLRLYSIDVAQTVNCREVSDTSWSEGSMTYNNRPPMGNIIDSLVTVVGTWNEFDVTSYITGDGVYSFGLEGSAGNKSFSSKEGTNPPELVIDYGGGGEPDTDPPTPDPMTWSILPYATGDTSISMTASVAADPSGVEYYFACTAGGGNDSGWQASTTYEDTGLTPSTMYTYTTKARDLSTNQNETATSTAESATTNAGCTASTSHVDSIVLAAVNCGQGKKNGQVTVTVYDDCGNPVANADVDGTFTGDYNETILDVTTDGNGVAVFTSAGCLKKPNYQFCVDDITHASLTYASGDNTITCDSY